MACLNTNTLLIETMNTLKKVLEFNNFDLYSKDVVIDISEKLLQFY